MKKKEKYSFISVQLSIVIFLVFFFTELCPLIVFDSDDWYYLCTFRLPIPMWKIHNPTRVMPETLMPLAGWLAARIIYPICGNYVYAITAISAIIITFLIETMCICLYRLLVARLKLREKDALICEVMFLIFFFLIFRNKETSQCMFSAADLCCVYFYTMSGILNAIIVLILLRYTDMTEAFLSWGWWQKSFFAVILYFALFSNLFHSAIIAIFAGSQIIMYLFDLYKRKICIKQFVFKNVIYLLIVGIWGIVLTFEASGERAGEVGVKQTLELELSVRQFIAVIDAIPERFIFLIVGIVLVLTYLIHKRVYQKTEMGRIFATLLCNQILITIFLLLLNAKVRYMSRIDASWGIWFWLIAITTIAIAYILREVPAATKVAPLVIPLLIIGAAYPGGKFSMSTREHTDYQTCSELDNYMIDSIVKADKDGQFEIEIRIPDHSDDLRSLTYNEELGNQISDCLYQYGIIDSRVKVKTILDSNMSDSEISSYVE